MQTLLLPARAQAGETWRITTLEWPPYCGSDLPAQGLAIQALRELVEKEEIRLEVEFLPWPRAKQRAAEPGYTGYYPAWPEEVDKGFTGSPPVYWSEIGVMTYDGSGLEWHGPEALFEHKVGLVKNYVYPSFITEEAAKKKENIDPTTDETALLRKLSHKRFKAAITDPAVMLNLARREKITNIRVMTILGKHPLVLAFPTRPETMEKLKLLRRLLTRNSSTTP